MTSLERKPSSTAKHSPLANTSNLRNYLQVKKNSAPNVKLSSKPEVKATRKIESIISMKALRTEMERTQNTKLGEKKAPSKSPPNRLIYLGAPNGRYKPST